MIAFLDASPLIYLVDGEAPWAEATQTTLQQLAVEAPDLATGREPPQPAGMSCSAVAAGRSSLPRSL